MTTRQARIRSRFEDEATRIRTRLDRLQRQRLPGITPVIEAGDIVDRAAEQDRREAGQAQVVSLTRRLGEIEAALARIEAGTYGTCEVCGGSIAAGRLEALPYTTMCARDREAAERNRDPATPTSADLARG